MSTALKPNDLDAHFMPFTPQHSFKKKPRMIKGAKGMYYYSDDDRELLDASAGLWCVNAGHNHPKIIEAIRKQARRFRYDHELIDTSREVGPPLSHFLAKRAAKLKRA